MGSEDLFKKRKAKKEHARAKPKKEAYDKVLIVCEGGKTEPNYFRDLAKCLDLASTNVRVTGDCGSDPLSVVEHGILLFEEELEKGEEHAFDRVFCVFDRDGHHQQSNHRNIFAEAINRAKQYEASLQKRSGKKSTEQIFRVIRSIPCFEYWLLLHYVDHHKPFANSGKNSVGAMVERELRKHWSNYSKGIDKPYSYLLDTASATNLDEAIKHAARRLNAAENEADPNPSTEVHLLVEYLRNIKQGN